MLRTLSSEIHTDELGAEAELDRLELRELGENPMVAIASRKTLSSVRADHCDRVKHHSWSLALRVRPRDAGP
jgi:hypothetical protein